MIIGFDVDDVLVDTCPCLLNYLNDKFNTMFKKEDVRGYFVQDLYSERREEAEQEVFSYMKKYGLYIPAVSGSKEGIGKLETDDLLAITRRKNLEEQTSECLEREFDKRINEIHYAGLNGGKRKKKSEIITDRKVDIYVDDNLDLALDCAKTGIKILLLDQPWNKNGDLPKNVKRVSNWSEILDEIESHRLTK